MGKRRRPQYPLCRDAGGNIRDASGEMLELPFCCPPRRTTTEGLPEHICEHKLAPSATDIMRDLEESCSRMDTQEEGEEEEEEVKEYYYDELGMEEEEEIKDYYYDEVGMKEEDEEEDIKDY